MIKLDDLVNQARAQPSRKLVPSGFTSRPAPGGGIATCAEVLEHYQAIGKDLYDGMMRGRRVEVEASQRKPAAAVRVGVVGGVDRRGEAVAWGGDVFFISGKPLGHPLVRPPFSPPVKDYGVLDVTGCRLRAYGEAQHMVLSVDGKPQGEVTITQYVEIGTQGTVCLLRFNPVFLATILVGTGVPTAMQVYVWPGSEPKSRVYALLVEGPRGVGGLAAIGEEG